MTFLGFFFHWTLLESKWIFSSYTLAIDWPVYSTRPIRFPDFLQWNSHSIFFEEEEEINLEIPSLSTVRLLWSLEIESSRPCCWWCKTIERILTCGLRIALVGDLRSISIRLNKRNLSLQDKEYLTDSLLLIVSIVPFPHYSYSPLTNLVFVSLIRFSTKMKDTNVHFDKKKKNQ